MEFVDDTIETKTNGASLNGELGQPALRAVEELSAHSDQEPITPINTGSLVTLRLIEQDREVVVYISKTENSINQLPSALKDQLPEKTSVHPLEVEGGNIEKKSTATLAERLEGRSVGDSIELVNHTHAEVIEVRTLDNTM